MYCCCCETLQVFNFKDMHLTCRQSMMSFLAQLFVNIAPQAPTIICLCTIVGRIQKAIKFDRTWEIVSSDCYLILLLAIIVLAQKISIPLLFVGFIGLNPLLLPLLEIPVLVHTSFKYFDILLFDYLFKLPIIFLGIGLDIFWNQTFGSWNISDHSHFINRWEKPETCM